MLNKEQTEAAPLSVALGQKTAAVGADQGRSTGAATSALRPAVVLALVGVLIGCMIGYLAFGKPLAAGILCFALGVLACQVTTRQNR